MQATHHWATYETFSGDNALEPDLCLKEILKPIADCLSYALLFLNRTLRRITRFFSVVSGVSFTRTRVDAGLSDLTGLSAFVDLDKSRFALLAASIRAFQSLDI